MNEATVSRHVVFACLVIEAVLMIASLAVLISLSTGAVVAAGGLMMLISTAAVMLGLRSMFGMAQCLRMLREFDEPVDEQ